MMMMTITQRIYGEVDRLILEAVRDKGGTLKLARLVGIVSKFTASSYVYARISSLERRSLVMRYGRDPAMVEITEEGLRALRRAEEEDGK